ncbi:hypothetical protein GWR56_15150 [Mucilaginibacter sp. 14171R-50]|uniref:hypothetical protein n=1 Tax=Mucilaginibacter sp. 14171R-50 TaxID=2703789 RepID=UPI00138C1E45|nr:hypothetical protein [Mucilaginibacter sp. 14171R-50]QHS56816.1 hypothetical protein GWR56_15150 [Mucilaginibacter sp. 14171R-50]
MDDSNSTIKSNAIELHYWFNDGSHLMDASIQNKCEYEFLNIVKEIALIYKVEIIIETEPLNEGGLIRWFKIALKDENKKASVTIALITALVTAIIVTPVTTAISKATEHLIEKLFEDSEKKDLEKEKLKLEIKKLKQETELNSAKLDSSNIIRKRRSNFYELLEKYPKVEKVSFVPTDNEKSHTKEEITIPRTDFKNFILATDDLEPIEVDNAVIEIISPVLKKGKYKWMGLYNGEIVSFSMKSTEFKSLVQLGKVQFKNGTSINCCIIIYKKIDSDGLEKLVNVEVTRVNQYFQNDTPIETPEGKQHRRRKEAESAQTDLFAYLK